MSEPCKDCKHLDTDVCCECPTFDGHCTCSTSGNPPCGYCEGSLWEEETDKASSSVPDAKPIAKGDMSMKNSRFDIEIVREKTTDDKTENDIVVGRYEAWAVDSSAAHLRATKEHGTVILEQEDAGWEVKILVHPFCE